MSRLCSTRRRRMSIRTLPNAGNALALLLGIASRVLSSHSTVAMIVHPIALTCQEPSTVDAGAFLDGTICDAAKVVGAGISASNEAGEFATPVRLRECLDRTRRPRSRKRTRTRFLDFLADRFPPLVFFVSIFGDKVDSRPDCASCFVGQAFDGGAVLPACRATRIRTGRGGYRGLPSQIGFLRRVRCRP